LNEKPFSDVFITGLIRDQQGRKMSKSLGNGIDPLDVIENYGADALRFALISGNTPGNDMRFNIEKVETYRNFANKIWNASRFVLMNLADYEYDSKNVPADFVLADRWILSRLQMLITNVTSALDNYEPGEASRLLYEFIWDEFCDWYIEMAKSRLYDKTNPEYASTAKWVLTHVLEKTMRLLHPFMPFITEEIWQNVAKGESVMVSLWPTADNQFADIAAQSEMTFVMNCVRAVRNLRAEVNTPPGKKSEAIIYAPDVDAEILTANSNILNNLASATPLVVRPLSAGRVDDAMIAVVENSEIYLPLKGLIDIDLEIKRLDKELESLKKETARLEAKLENSAFIAKAPLEVVAKERDKLNEYQEKYSKIAERSKYLRGL
ncbi:MAG: class I tRNA ligase family protein, partial [Bacillota bacterium]